MYCTGCDAAGKKMEMTSLSSWIQMLHFVEHMIYLWFVLQVLPRAGCPEACFQHSSIARNMREGETGARTSGLVQAEASCTLAPIGCLGEETSSKTSLLRILLQECGEGGLKTREEKGAI